VAAAVWGLQQPLDKLVFSSRFDDIEFLGKAVTREDGWYPIGFAIHMSNGAVFGALYANVAPALPIPAPLRGPAAAFAEHLLTWPLGAISDRVHPARGELPALNGNKPAFLQALWRHLLFGLVNAEPEPAPPEPEADFSSNGHGSLAHAVSVQQAD
jgi:hypothetical protein